MQRQERNSVKAKRIGALQDERLLLRLRSEAEWAFLSMVDEARLALWLDDSVSVGRGLAGASSSDDDDVGDVDADANADADDGSSSGGGGGSGSCVGGGGGGGGDGGLVRCGTS